MALLPIFLLLAACASHPTSRAVGRSHTGKGPAVHVVLAGETLYSIALRYDRDYRELARLNGLDSNFTIHPGQRLRLRGTPARRGRPSRAGSKTPESASNPASTARKPTPESAEKVASQTSVRSSFSWGWPAKGEIIGRFGAQGVTGKGMDIAGKRGDPVRAAADGVVVYVGSSLVGYGRLLIVRHDDNFISAYAHNDRFLVKEGESVKRGQTIAELGSSGTDRDMLHFEIREHGKPVDPLRYLPAQ